MTAAALICAHLKEHGEATRPQIQRALVLGEKTVETTMRKLVARGYVAKTGRMHKEWRKRSATIFRLGDLAFDQQAFSSGPVRRGRPRIDEVLSRPTKVYSFDALSAIASGRFFSMEAA